MDILQLVRMLHDEKCSCVIWNKGTVTLCHERGIKDLYALLADQPSVLSGAMIADKVIGKGAAALMLLGNVASVYADVISQPALDLFNTREIEVRYDVLVPNIVNRSGTGMCPVEALCLDCIAAEECLPKIEKFISKINTPIS